MEAQRYSGPGGGTPRFHHKEIGMVIVAVAQRGSPDEEPDPARNHEVDV